MRIKVKQYGHQHLYQLEGEVIQWCSAVERYGEAYLQVPAVVVNTGDAVKIVPLQQHLYWSEIEIL